MRQADDHEELPTTLARSELGTPPESGNLFETGQIVATRFLILGKLGAGGMGVVYEAMDQKLDRRVALKVLPTDKASDEEYLRRLTREAKAASSLNHPNIVTVYDVFSEGGLPFIVMEYVRGATLAQLIPAQGMGVGEALKIAVQIADALAVAASGGITHRDIKPGNVMVTETGLVKVLDFGLAKVAPAARTASEVVSAAAGAAPAGSDASAIQDQPQTIQGAILGTMSYMSPEQALGNPVDPRSDIFSFGAVVYEMLTGQRAFRGGSADATLSAVVSEEPKPLTNLVSGVPNELDQVVQRCLRKNVDERFAQMSDVKTELEKLQADSALSVMRGLAPGSLPQPGKTKYRLAVVAMTAAALLVAGWYLRPKVAAPAALYPVPLTSDPGLETNPGFSPDGSHVVYTWTGEQGEDGNLDIYVKLVGGDGKPVRLTTDPRGDDCAAWSPDGRTIAFLRFGDANTPATLYQIAPLGGVERKITEGLFRWSFSRDISTGTLSWTPDSKYIAGAAREATEETYSIYLYSATTGERRRLTTPPAAATDQSPAISPDGRSLLFVRCTNTNYCDLMLTELTTEFTPRGEPSKLLPEQGEIGGAAWTSDGKAIVYGFTKSAISNVSLFRLSLGTSAPERLTVAGEGATNPTISLRGNRLAYVVSTTDSDIWQAGPGRKPQPVVASTRSERSPQYSPDGSKIAFTSDRSGVPGVWTCGQDGSNPVHLTRQIKRYCGTPRWSPDGMRIAFDSQGPEQWEIWTINAEGGRERQVTRGAGNKNTPSWSRDGQWIYYVLTQGNGRPEVWKAPANGGDPLQVTRDGGFTAFESPDGKWVYYTKSGVTSALFRMPLSGGQESKVVEDVVLRGFQVFDDGVYYLTRQAGASDAQIALRFHRLATGTSEPIARLGGPLHAGLSVSPDRKAYLYSPFVRTGSDMMLVENFR